jgi:hypothetical protein
MHEGTWNIEVEVLWVMTPHSLVVGHQCFGGPRCLHLQSEMMAMLLSPTTLLSIITQKTTWISTAVKISNLGIWNNLLDISVFKESKMCNRVPLPYSWGMHWLKPELHDFFLMTQLVTPLNVVKGKEVKKAMFIWSI